ncbi:hypothetical protein QQ045_010605 [Rhodiola kirilowii]
MAKTKTQKPKRSPLLDAPEVTSKCKMKLRSPSSSRVLPQLRSAESPPSPDIEAPRSPFTDTISASRGWDEGGEKQKVRGVVNGSNLAFYKHTRNKGRPIKVEFLSDGTGPADQKVCSLLVHEIGSVVKDKVPMRAPSFRKLKEKDRQIVQTLLFIQMIISCGILSSKGPLRGTEIGSQTASYSIKNMGLM